MVRDPATNKLEQEDFGFLQHLLHARHGSRWGCVCGGSFLLTAVQLGWGSCLVLGGPMWFDSVTEILMPTSCTEY